MSSSRPASGHPSPSASTSGLVLEASNLAEGKLRVKWNNHQIDEIQISWGGHGADLTGKDLSQLAAHIYEMYKEEIAALKGPGTLNLSTVDAKVKADTVTKVRRQQVEVKAMQATAQAIYNLVMGKGGLPSPAASGKGLSHHRFTPLSGDLSATSLTAVAEPVLEDSGALLAAQRRIAALEEQLRIAKDGAADLRGELKAERKDHRSTREKGQKLLRRAVAAETKAKGLKRELHIANRLKDRLSERVDDLTRENHDLRLEVDRFALALDASDEKIRRLEGALGDKTDELRVQLDLTRTKQARIEELTEANVAFQAALDVKTRALAELEASGRPEDRATIADLRAEVLVAGAEVAVKERELVRLQETHALQVRLLQDQIEEKTRDLESERASHATDLVTLRRLETSSAAQVATIQALREKIDSLQTQLSAAERRGGASSQEVIRLREQLASSEERATQLLSQNGFLLGDNASLKMGADRLLWQLEQAHQSLQMQAWTIGWLNSQLGSQQLVVNSLSQDLMRATDRALLAEAKVDRLTHQLDAAAAVIEAARREAHEAKLKVSELTSALGLANTELDSLRAQVPELESQLSVASAALVAKDRELAQKEATISQQTSLLKRLVDKLSGKGREIQTLTRQLKAVQKNLRKLERAIPEGITAKDLRGLLEGLRRERDDLAHQLEQARREQAEAEVEVSSVTAALTRNVAPTASGAAGTLATQIRELQVSLEASQDEVGREKALNRDLRSRLAAAEAKSSSAELALSQTTKDGLLLAETVRVLREKLTPSAGSTPADLPGALDALKTSWALRESELQEQISRLSSEAQAREHRVVEEVAAARRPLELQIEQLQLKNQEQQAELLRQLIQLRQKDKLLSEAVVGKEVLQRQIQELRSQIIAQLSGQSQFLNESSSAEDIAGAISRVFRSKDKQIKDLRSQVQSLILAHRTLESSSGSTIKDLNARLTQLDAERKQALETAREAQAALSLLQNEVTGVGGLAAKLAALTRELRAKKEALADAENRLERLASKGVGFDRLQDLAQQLQREGLVSVTGLGSSTDTHQFIEAMARELKAQKATVASQAARIQELERELIVAQSAAVDAGSEVERLTLALSQSTRELTQLRGIEARVTQLQSDLLEAVGEVADLKRQLRSLQGEDGELAHAQKAYQEASARERTLARELSKLQADLLAMVPSSIDGVARSSDDLIAAIEFRITTIEGEKNAALREVEVLRESVLKAEQKAQRANKKNEELEQELIAIRKRLQTEIAGAGNSAAALQGLREQIAASFAAVNVSLGDISSLSVEELARLVNEKTMGLNSIALEANRAREAVQEELVTIKAQLAEKTSLLQAAEARIGALERTNQELTAEVDSLRSANQVLGEDNARQARMLAGLSITLSENQQIMQDLSQGKDAAVAESERLRRVLTDLEGDISGKTSELSALQVKLESMRTDAAADKEALERVIKQLSDQINESKEAYRALERQLEISRKTSEQATAKLEAFGVALGAGDRDPLQVLNELKAKLASAEASIVSIEAQRLHLDTGNQSYAAQIERLKSEQAVVAASLEQAAVELDALRAENSSLKGRVRELESAQTAWTVDRVALEEKVHSLRGALAPVFVHLNVDLARSLGYPALDASFRSLAAAPARVQAQVIEAADIVAKAKRIETLASGIPHMVAAGTVDALVSEEVARDISVYAQILDLLATYEGPEERKELILNLMLVVASHNQMAVHDSAKACLARWLSEEPGSQKMLQVAAALSLTPGYLSEEISGAAWGGRGVYPVSLPNGAQIQQEAKAAISAFDRILNTSELSNAERQRLKSDAKTHIETYLAKVGFVISPDQGVEALAEYVRTWGEFPGALKSYLAAGERKDKAYQEILARMLYHYTACDSQDRGRFKTIASLEKLDWLTRRNPSDKQASFLLEFIRCAGKGMAFTHEQIGWGREVEEAMNGGTANPIYAPGGAGKTVTVQHFMRLLSKIATLGLDTTARPLVFVSPFAQQNAAGTGEIINKMLPPPNSDNEILLSMGTMPEALMRQASKGVVIDECHIIRPEMKVYLINDAGEKIHVPKYLQLTASPLTTGYNLEAATRTALDVVSAERARLVSKLEAVDASRDVEPERRLKIIASLKLLFQEEAANLLEVTKEHPNYGDFNHTFKTTYDSVREELAHIPVSYERLKPLLIKFIGGHLIVTGTGDVVEGTGLLGNKKCVDHIFLKRLHEPGDEKISFLRRLELLALEIGEGKANMYETRTTKPARVGKGARSLVERSAREIALDSAHNEQVLSEMAKDNIFTAKLNIRASIQALDEEQERLEILLREYRESSSLGIYRETKARREKALGSMEVKHKDLLSWDTEPGDCLRVVAQSLNSVRAEFKDRVQMIFPGLRFNEANLAALIPQLKPGEGEKPRVFMYHDSHSAPDSGQYGQNRCIVVDSSGASRKMSLKEYQESQGLDGAVSFSGYGFSHQIVMLYDDTNKQGGDYGIFSQANAGAGDPISQLIFLNIREKTTSPNPGEYLSSGDLYQAQCRRRTSSDADGKPPAIVFSAVSDTYRADAIDAAARKQMLLELPVSLLFESISRADLSDRQRALLTAIQDNHEALVNMFMTTPGCSMDPKTISLISGMQVKQREIESFLQQTGAVNHIASRIFKIEESLERLSFADTSGPIPSAPSVVDDDQRRALASLKGRVRYLNADTEVASAKLRRMQTEIASIKGVFERLRDKYTISDEDIALLKVPSAHAPVATVVVTPVAKKPASAGAVRRAPVAAETAATGFGLARARAAHVIALKTPAEEALYKVITETLSTISQIEAYIEQGLPRAS